MNFREDTPAYIKRMTFFFGVAISLAAVFFSFTPNAQAAVNLIPNPSMEQEGTNSTPVDWIKGRWGTNTAVFTYPVAGAGSDKAGKVVLTSYTSGDAKWAFLPVSVDGGEEYLFSNKYKSNVTSYVTVEFTRSNGSKSYLDLEVLPPASNYTSFSETFTAPSDAVTASVFHVIKSVGEITVDDYVLEEVEGSTPPPPADPNNLISNASVETAGSNNTPVDWTKGRWGTNVVTFEYPVSGQHGDKALQIKMTSRSTGDAKWAFKSVPIEAGKMYQFTNYYKSDVPTYLTLQYTMSDGSFRYPDLALLPPSSSWQKTEHSFTPPSGAKSVTVFHLINQVGTLTTDNYTLARSNDDSEPPKGIVTLSFDDGWKSIYENAIPILNDAGLKSSQYIITGRFEFPAFMTEEQVLAMQAQGHEIGAHTVTHRDLTTLSLSEAREEIEKSKQDLLDIGINSVTTLAYPFGAYNQTIKNLTMEAGYLAARSTDSGFNEKGTLNLFALKRQPVNVNNSAAQVKGWIDQAVENDQWLILALHNIDRSGVLYSTTPETLQEIVNYLKQKNVRVVTLEEGVEIMQ